MQLTIFTDGGSRGNPGPAACAFIARANGELVHQGTKALGTQTNNDAEYSGFILSLEWLESVQNIATTYESVTWKLDSKLVVEQLNKRWKIKEPRMREYAATCWKLLSALPVSTTIVHVPREENALADALLNQTLDNLS